MKRCEMWLIEDTDCDEKATHHAEHLHNARSLPLGEAELCESHAYDALHHMGARVYGPGGERCIISDGELVELL